MVQTSRGFSGGIWLTILQASRVIRNLGIASKKLEKDIALKDYDAATVLMPRVKAAADLLDAAEARIRYDLVQVGTKQGAPPQVRRLVLLKQ